MCFCVDKSLKDLCKENSTPMDDKEALFYWGQVVDSVQHNHDKGIIHKDIKGIVFATTTCMTIGPHARLNWELCPFV